MPVSSYGLALHTVSPVLGLAIANFAGDRREQTWDLGRATSNVLHTYLMEFVEPQTWADLSFVAVAQGPGGFTGTRIGLVTARTLAQQLDLPVFPISTLAAVAWEWWTQQHNAAEGAIAVEMPAQRGEVFGGIYHPGNSPWPSLRTEWSDRSLPQAAWEQTLATWPTTVHLVHATQPATAVGAVLDLAYGHWQAGARSPWSEALPFYGQHPVT